MTTERIDLYEHFNVPRPENAAGYLNTYVPFAITEIKPKLRPAMLVIAGGGYKIVSQREKEVVAVKYSVDGYSAFTLDYSVDTPYPFPLLEACMAVIYIRQNAAKYNVDVNHVAAIGFSAGGHLAAMLSNIYDEKEIRGVLGDKVNLAKLDAVLLCYPVITMGQSTHQGTRDIITGGNKELAERLSMEKRVTKNSAPAFLWHVFEDDCVDVSNSLMLAQAYRKEGVPFSLHVFEKGWHGVSVCSDETENNHDVVERLTPVAKWYDLSVDWLASRGFRVQTVL